MAGESVEVDGSGIGSLDGGSTAASTLHLRFEAQLKSALTKRSEIQTWEGSQADIVAAFLDLSANIGTIAEQGSTPEIGKTIHLGGGGSATSGEAYAEPRLEDVSAPRRQGNVWTMQVTYSQVRYVTIWSLDFADIDKPVKTWLQGTENAPDLALLSQWELAKEKEDWANYDAYKTVNGVALDGNTLKLAKMMREDGIESYTLHTPVATCQVTYPTFPSGAGGILDKQFADLPKAAGGWPDMGGDDTDAIWSEIDGLKADWAGDGTAGVWLCTADPVHPNADGTYTRSTQFTLVTSANIDLYPEGTATDGGFA